MPMMPPPSPTPPRTAADLDDACTDVDDSCTTSASAAEAFEVGQKHLSHSGFMRIQQNFHLGLVLLEHKLDLLFLILESVTKTVSVINPVCFSHTNRLR
jgi:hypothetical protein